MSMDEGLVEKRLDAIPIHSFVQSGAPGHELIADFLEPHLSAAVTYDRAAGYFSSTVLASAARGISGFVVNGGKMRLLTSHIFTRSDYATIEDYVEADFENALVSGVEVQPQLDDELAPLFENHLAAMIWMLREGLLEIRIVIPNEDAEDLNLFHPKFGIFTDDFGNRVAFGGSINETSSAWSRNYENFDVFQSWIDGREEYIVPKQQLFDELWELGSSGQWQTLALPDAVANRLIEDFAPDDFPNLRAPDVTAEVDDVDPTLRKMRAYQVDAIKAWESAGRKGILEMATGTGKTKTATTCIRRLADNRTLLTVVIAPYQHICEQWVKELQSMQPVFAGPNWKQRIETAHNEVVLERSNNLTIVAVQDTASSAKFVELIESIASDYDDVLIVGDEVHWLGATAYQNAMFSAATCRLGLSATTKRYFDEEGTDVVLDYFGGIVFTFSLRDALDWRLPDGGRILSDYSYQPVFVSLTDLELADFKELSRQVTSMQSQLEKLRGGERSQLQLRITKLLLKRADILKTAESKLSTLENFVGLNPDKLDYCLIYCANNEQLDAVAKVLLDLGVETQKITGSEGTHPEARFGGVSERDYYISKFASGAIRVLLAIRCLDEGVDIPSARVAIIMASSGNPKEFIQRRGRLMRPYPGKERAEIIDLCVLPSSGDQVNKSIARTELGRIREFAEEALNASEIIQQIEEMEGEIEES